jgi:hypothetical protein
MGVKQGYTLPLIPFKRYSDYLIKEVLEGFGDLKIGGKIISTVKLQLNLFYELRNK